MTNFGADTPFILLAKITVKEDKVSEYLELADDFTVEVYGTVGDKCLEVMKGTGVPFKVFQTKLGYSRL